VRGGSTGRRGRSAAFGLGIVLCLPHLVIASPPQETRTEKLTWDPPEVDGRMKSISELPECVLPDVLQAAKQKSQELLDHLQNFIAHEQIRYEQRDEDGLLELSLGGKFDCLVDFGKRNHVLDVQERRTQLGPAAEKRFNAILDSGLPVLALIFSAELQGDYDMHCEGLSEWNGEPAWVVHFRQMKGKRPRTLTVGSANKSDVKNEYSVPLRLKGRAWIEKSTGQVMHLEASLADPVLRLRLLETAFRVDYAAVNFQSQKSEIWLPKFAVGYIDYMSRRMIIEHSFYDFQLFSVDTNQEIHGPKEPQL
jgi:hypothetical protein